MRSDTARLIEQATGKPPGWLDQDHGQVHPGTPPPAPALPHPTALPAVRIAQDPGPAPEGCIRLPQLNVTAQGGTGKEPPAHLEIVRWLDVAQAWAQAQFQGRAPHIQVLTAEGHSMAGAGILSGDLLFVDTGVRRYTSDGFYVFSFRDGVQVKRLRANLLKDRLEIVSQPDAEETIQTIEPEQEEHLRIAGRVAAWWTLKK